MKIDFYEEFPSEKNLQKLKLIKYSIRLFVTARSVKEFRGLERKVKQIKRDTEVAYWPILKNSYWISPFSNTEDLNGLFNQLNKCNNQILIDLELPLKKRFIIKNIFNYSKNRKIIKEFLEKNKQKIITAQFPSSLISFYMKILGLDYNINLEKSLMWYSSMTPSFMNKNIKKNLYKLKNKNNYSISLGTIATGILGDEPILSPNKLEEDLEFVKNADFKKVIIFRLGGLNKDYIKVINKFIDS